MFKEEYKPIIQGGSRISNFIEDWEEEKRDFQFRKRFENEVQAEIDEINSLQMEFDLNDNKKKGRPIKSPAERKRNAQKRKNNFSGNKKFWMMLRKRFTQK